jgi:hypothetical protein
MTQYSQNLDLISGDSYDIEMDVPGTIPENSTVEFILIQDDAVVKVKTTDDGITIADNKINIHLSTSETTLLSGVYRHVTRLINNQSVNTLALGTVRVDRVIPTENT